MAEIGWPMKPSRSTHTNVLATAALVSLCVVMLTTSWLRNLRSVQRRRRARPSCSERLESRELLAAAAVYVDGLWTGLPVGTDPDGSGPATSIGVDAFADIASGIAAVADTGTVNIRPGTYVEAVQISKPLTLQGTSNPLSVIIAPGAGSNGVTIASPHGAVALRNFTISGTQTAVDVTTNDDVLLDLLVADDNAVGVHVAQADDLTINDGRYADISVRSTDSVTLQGSRINSTGNIDIETQNAISVGTTIDVGASTLRFIANLDGSDNEGFSQAINTTIKTTNDSIDAVRIEVNTLLGGNGDATIGRI